MSLIILSIFFDLLLKLSFTDYFLTPIKFRLSFSLIGKHIQTVFFNIYNRVR